MHKCKALVISCIDFRFQSKVREYALDKGLKDNYDLIAVAGAAKSIEEDGFLMEQIDISYKLHGIEEVHIIFHEDCGAYGGSQSFSSQEEEYNTYTLAQEQAEQLILSKYPELKVFKEILRK